VDRILEDAYLGGIDGRSTDEIRAMRDECEEEESGVSFARRMIQGKLDILREEALRRREVGDSGSTTLLAALPTLLGDDGPTSVGNVRVTRFLVPPSVHYHRRDVEWLLGDDALVGVDVRSADELARLVGTLAAKEAELSALRRRLLERLDRLQEELIRRYKDGSAHVREVLPRMA